MKKICILFLLLPFCIAAQEVPSEGLSNAGSSNNSIPYNGSPYVDSNAKGADRSLIPIYDSIQFFLYDGEDGQWVPDEKITDIVYNGTRKISQLTVKFIGGSWQNLYFDRFYYSEPGDADTNIRQEWIEGQWVNYQRIIRTLDANNRERSYLRQVWTDNEWKDNDAYDQELNEDGYMLWKIYKSVGLSGVLTETVKHVRTYLPGNMLLTELRQSWMNGTWIDEYLATHTYIDNHRDSSKYQYWIDGIWQVDYTDKYYYDDQNHLDKIHRVPQQLYVDNEQISDYEYIDDYTTTLITQKIDGEWVNIYNWKYKYIGNFNIYFYSWKWNNNQWVISSADHYSWDQNILTGSSGINYDWLTGDSTHYYFHTVVGLQEIPGKNLSVYPNPGNGLFTIDTKEPITAIEVYNSTGLKVLHPSLPVSTIDLNALPKGIYLLRINLNGTVVIRKVIKN